MIGEFPVVFSFLCSFLCSFPFVVCWVWAYGRCRRHDGYLLRLENGGLLSLIMITTTPCDGLTIKSCSVLRSCIPCSTLQWLSLWSPLQSSVLRKAVYLME